MSSRERTQHSGNRDQNEEHATRAFKEEPATSTLRRAAILVVIGLTEQISTALWNHPLAFLAFMFVASPITAAGTLLYLVTLARET